MNTIWGSVRAHWRKIIAVIVALCLLGGIGYVVYAFTQQRDNPIPTEVSNALTFSPLILPNYVTDYTTSNYQIGTGENQEQFFTYDIHGPNDTIVSVTESRQPPEFSEVAEYKDRFLTNVVMQTSSISTAGGTLYLGRQARQADKQLAVMLERGLLIFMNPSRPLDESTWRDIADQLEIQRMRKK